jgi:hypothetical protein
MYNKIFAKILDSSIWLEDDPTRIVWITFIAAMDETGFAPFAALGNLASRAHVSLEAAKVAVGILESPDPESSDPENDGRRIEKIPGGWMILNAGKYREIVTRANSQEKNRERVRRFRAKKKAQSNDDIMNGNAANGLQSALPQDVEPTPPQTALNSPESDSGVGEGAGTPATPPTRQCAQASPQKFELPTWIPTDLWLGFEEMRKTIRAPLTDHGRRNIINELQRQKDAGGDPLKTLNESITKSWRGVYPANGTVPSSASPETPDSWAELIECHCPACGDRRREAKLQLYQGTAFCLKCEARLLADAPIEVHANASPFH